MTPEEMIAKVKARAKAEKAARVIAKGLPAGPGAASGNPSGAGPTVQVVASGTNSPVITFAARVPVVATAVGGTPPPADEVPVTRARAAVLIARGARLAPHPL
jgi:hypothetical protein